MKTKASSHGENTPETQEEEDDDDAEEDTNTCGKKFSFRMELKII